MVHLYQFMCKSFSEGEACRRSLWKVIPWFWMNAGLGVALVVGLVVVPYSLQPLTRQIGGCVSIDVGVKSMCNWFVLVGGCVCNVYVSAESSIMLKNVTTGTDACSLFE